MSAAQSPVPTTTNAPPEPSAKPAAGRPWRERAAAWALGLAALSLLGIALVHGAAYVTASIALANSGLSPAYKEAFGSLWLGFSLQATVLAGVLGLAALRPSSVSRAVVGICGLLPVLSVALLQRSLGGTISGFLLAVACALVLAGMVLQPSRASGERRRAEAKEGR